MDQEMIEIIIKASISNVGPQQYHLTRGLSQFQGKWVIGKNGDLRKPVFKELHSCGVRGHSGKRASSKRIGGCFTGQQ